MDAYDGRTSGRREFRRSSKRRQGSRYKKRSAANLDKNQREYGSDMDDLDALSRISIQRILKGMKLPATGKTVDLRRALKSVGGCEEY